MSAVNVWEEQDIQCRCSFEGYTERPTAKFVFYKGSDKVGEKPAQILGKNGSCTWKTPKVDADKTFIHLTYKVEVNGTEKAGFVEDIYVWARKITINTVNNADNAAMPRAELTITQRVVPPSQKDKPNPTRVDSPVQRRTDDKGKLVYDLRDTSEVSIAVRAPFIGIDPGSWGAGQTRTVKVEKRLRAQIAFPLAEEFTDPTDDKVINVHRQWVNLDADTKHPDRGSKIKIRVRTAGPRDGDPGTDKIYLKAVFDGGNSDRTGVGLHAKGSTHTENKVLPPEREVEFELELGPAGGDKVVVSVGGTDACTDDKVTIMNWRKLYYEIAAPEAMREQLEARPLDNGVSGRDLPSEMRKWFGKQLGKAGVEYVCKKSHIYANDRAPAGSIMDKSFLQDNSGGKCMILGGSLRAPAVFDTAEVRTVQVSLCDRAFSVQNETPQRIENLYLTAVETDVPVSNGKYWFKINIGNGGDAVDQIGTWRASIPSGTGAHPGRTGGLAGGAAIGGPISRDWITFTDYKTLKIKLPTGPGEPGSLVGAFSATKCRIKILLFRVSITHGINGNAGGGKQLMVFSRPQQAGAATICHELGHSMGLAVMSGTNEPPPGLTAPAAVPGGTSYTGKGHAGTHCADSYTRDKAEDPYRGNGTCIMYGAGGDEVPPTRASFCASCLKMLKGRKLEDVHANYTSTRAEADR